MEQDTKSVWLEDSPYLLHTELKPVGDASVTDLICRWYSFDAQNAKFNYVNKKSISLATNYADTYIYGCKNQILDTGLGLKRPYFCLTTKKKKGDAINSSVTLHTTGVADDSSENFKIQTLASASCDSSTVESFSFMDGPRLTWKGEKYIYFLTKVTGGKFNLSQIRIRKMVKEVVQDPGTVEFMDLSALETSYLVLLVCRVEKKFLLFEVDSLDSKVNLRQSPIPQKYSMNVKTVELFCENNVIQTLLVNRQNEGFFLIDSELKMKLKFDGTPNVLFMFKHMVIETKTEVKIFDRDEVGKPISTFKSYPMVIGDFAAHGSEQLLLLAERPASQNAIRKFILTDFGVVYYDTIEDISEASSSAVDASMRTFSSAVESRLRTSVKWLVESENELQRKISHIRQSCENINKMAMDAPTNETKISLVPFLNTNNNNNEGEMDTSKKGVEIMPEIIRTWQLTVLGKLCIGIEMRVSDDIDAMSVGLIPREEFSNCCTVSKCVKNQDGVWNVICATDPPPMIRSELTCDVIVHFMHGISQRTAICDKVVLKSSEMRKMMDQEMTLNVSQPEVIDALSVVQLNVSLDVHSELLNENEDIFLLFQRLGFHSNEEKSGHHGDWLYHDMMGALGAVRVQGISCTRGKAVIGVHYKDRAQLLCLVHSLYELLGDEAAIRRHHGDGVVAMETESAMESEPMYDSDVIFDEP